MRYIVTILVLLLSIGASAQKQDSVYLVSSVADLNFALVHKDTTRLNILLKDDLHYFHSNGWEQSKRDVIEDLYNGKLTYNNISQHSREIHLMGQIAQVKTNVDIEAVLNGKMMDLKLNVVQVWVWKNGRWELYSRHSEKV